MERLAVQSLWYFMYIFEIFSFLSFFLLKWKIAWKFNEDYTEFVDQFVQNIWHNCSFHVCRIVFCVFVFFLFHQSFVGFNRSSFLSLFLNSRFLIRFYFLFYFIIFNATISKFMYFFLILFSEISYYYLEFKLIFVCWFLFTILWLCKLTIVIDFCVCAFAISVHTRSCYLL